jgi:hypothetical protein
MTTIAPLLKRQWKAITRYADLSEALLDFEQVEDLTTLNIVSYLAHMSAVPHNDSTRLNSQISE